MTIAFILLGKSKIETQKPFAAVSKLNQNVKFSLYFATNLFQVPLVFKIFSFSLKLYFFYFFVSSLRSEIKKSLDLAVERKYQLTLIMIVKTIIFYVNEFHSSKAVLSRSCQLSVQDVSFLEQYHAKRLFHMEII